MRIAVDVVTGPTQPKYTEELSRRLSREADVRVIPSKGYASSPLGMAYRLVHHPLHVSLHRRPEALLHVDSQMLAYLLAAPGRTPRVLTCHDLAPFHPEFDDPSYASRGRLSDALYYRLLHVGLRKADRIVAVSQFTADEIRQFGGDPGRVDVVPQGVDLAAYRPRERSECDAVRGRYGLPSGRPLVLYVGTEHPRKNLDGLYRAFARLRNDAILTKVGPPRQPQRRNLNALATSLGIANRIAVVDRVSEAEMPLLYGTSEALVLPSFYEGFGLPPLEAMACGTPVAVSRTASLPEVVGDAGLYFDPSDEGSITHAIERLLTEQPLRQELRARGFLRAGEFPWERTVRGVFASYRLALATMGSEG